MTDEHETRHLSRGQWVFYGFLAFAGLLLLTEHRAHVLGILPFLILLACPLMHLFMHHDHGSHDHGSHDHGSHDHGSHDQHTHNDDTPEGDKK